MATPLNKYSRFITQVKSQGASQAMLEALEQGDIHKGDVIVIRYEGPKGGLGKEVVLLIDGWFSGGSHGYILGRITPEAQEGSPIALLQDGDRITIDVPQNLIEADLSEET